MRTISIINQKGGCGKTTTAINLSACLAANNRRVLLVDMDPQAHSTMGLRASGRFANIDLRRALIRGHENPARTSQLKISIHENLDLIPSLVSMAALEQELSGAANREGRLRDLLLQAEESFDYIIIDAPPNLGILTINALVASHEILIPVESSYFSIRSLRRLTQVIEVVKKQANINPTIHILPTLFDSRTRISRKILAELQDRYQSYLLQTSIRQSIHLKEAAGYGLPVTKCLKKSLGHQDYQALTREIIAMEKKPSEATREKKIKIANNIPPQAQGLRVINTPPPHAMLMKEDS